MVVSLFRWYAAPGRSSSYLTSPHSEPRGDFFGDTSPDLPIRYNGRLAARPLLTQAVTTSILFATGDITAQQLVERRGLEKHDLTRTGRMALYGGCKQPAHP